MHLTALTYSRHCQSVQIENSQTARIQPLPQSVETIDLLQWLVYFETSPLITCFIVHKNMHSFSILPVVYRKSKSAAAP
jgi:hypothetical protein